MGDQQVVRREADFDAEVSRALLEFPERLKALFASQGSALQVAMRMGTSPTKLYAWTYRNKQGAVQMPNGHSLLCLAVATGVDINWLLLGRGTPPAPRPADANSGDPQ